MAMPILFPWYASAAIVVGGSIVSALSPELVPPQFVGPVVIGGLVLVAFGFITAIPTWLSNWKAGRERKMATLLFGLSGILIIAAAYVGVVGYYALNANNKNGSASSVSSAIKSEGKPERHYSTADMDEISNAIRDLRKIMNGDVAVLRKEFVKFRRPWRKLPRNVRKSMDIQGTLDQLAVMRGEASRLSALIFEKWLDDYSAHKSLLDSIVATKRPDPFKRFYQHADRIKVPLEQVNSAYEAAPEQFAAFDAIMSALIEPIENTHAQIGGWTTDTEERIAKVEQTVLTER